jgi:hypothetical protein
MAATTMTHTGRTTLLGRTVRKVTTVTTFTRTTCGTTATRMVLRGKRRVLFLALLTQEYGVDTTVPLFRVQLDA